MRKSQRNEVTKGDHGVTELFTQPIFRRKKYFIWRSESQYEMKNWRFEKSIFRGRRRERTGKFMDSSERYGDATLNDLLSSFDVTWTKLMRKRNFPLIFSWFRAFKAPIKVSHLSYIGSELRILLKIVLITMKREGQKPKWLSRGLEL